MRNPRPSGADGADGSSAYTATVDTIPMPATAKQARRHLSGEAMVASAPPNRIVPVIHNGHVGPPPAICATTGWLTEGASPGEP